MRRALTSISKSNKTLLIAVLVISWILFLRRSVLHNLTPHVYDPSLITEPPLPDIDDYGIESEPSVPNTKVETLEVTKKIEEVEIDEVVPNEKQYKQEEDTGIYDKLVPITSIPTTGLLDVRAIAHPGVPKDAYQWKADYSFIKTNMDLPRIFPPTAKDWNDTINHKVKVCVFNRAPRQRSLWATDILAMFGSGKYHYESLEATTCQFFGTCKSKKESLTHPDCNVNVSPTVGLIEWVKCCFHDRFANAMQNHAWDIAVATGDEYCSAHKSSDGYADFRFYFDGNISAEIRKPAVYLPLGPREEFRRVKPEHVTLASDRQYVFNFVGSLTSKSRRILSMVLRRGVEPSGTSSFLHVIGTWAKQALHSTGYLLPHEYRRVLLNSTFTLCPDGHNPEAYRIYEAIEAGSIPIVALDEYYLSHKCQHAFAPLIQSGAPLVYLNSWTGLKGFLQKVYDKPELLVKMQADVMAWYAKWMRLKAFEFESKMESNFNKRTGNGN